MSIATVNPLNNETLKTFDEPARPDIESTLERAQKTFLEWRKRPFADRSKLMHKAADLLRERKERYADLMTLEMGKVHKEAIAEVEKCADVCDFYADHAAEFLADEPVETEAHKSMIVYNPLGVVLAIMPWNFPFWQVFRFAAPNLMAGNVGVLKHASNVPQCALAIEEVFRDAGFPPCTFSTLLISSEQVESVIAHPVVRAVTLTGSEKAGQKVAETAGKYLKKTVLELGGSDPFIVLADADLEKAAKVAVQARMINTGQSCIAAKRFIVEQKVADRFLERMRHHMEALQGGDPNDDVDYGPMAREDLANDLLEQVEQSVAMGARVVLGGKRPDREGAFLEPTILTDVKPGMPAWEEELFGPVAVVIPVQDVNEAIEVANASPYGLGGSVWTQDLEKGEQVARELETGGVFINALYKSDQRLPFGGVKRSGYGRELSYIGIREFMNQKTVWIEAKDSNRHHEKVQSE